MDRISWAIFAGSILSFALMLPLFIADWAGAQNENTTSQNATTPQKSTTKMVVNMSDHTIKIVNMTSNEIISVRNFTTGNETKTSVNETGTVAQNQTLDIANKMKSLLTPSN